MFEQPCCNVIKCGGTERGREGRKEGRKEVSKVLTDDRVRAWNCILVQIML